jgi:glycosyltransferase involved in cell wall biosynthesis
MYRIGLKSSQVIFQNEDDLRQFQQYNLVEKKQVNIIRGSGVDIQRFTPTPEPDGRKVVVLPARMLWDKGVAEFVQAARILGKENLNAIFVLVGDTYTEIQLLSLKQCCGNGNQKV